MCIRDRRYSMIGDGLSHVGFGALSVALAMNVAPLGVSIPVVTLAAFLLLRLSENSKIKGDAAIALISSSSLAIGVIVTSQTTGFNVDVYGYMFGSILAMSEDVYKRQLLWLGCEESPAIQGGRAGGCSGFCSWGNSLHSAWQCSRSGSCSPA